MTIHKKGQAHWEGDIKRGKGTVSWKQARRLFNPDHLSMPSVPTLTGSIFIAVIKTDRWKRTITLPS